MLRQQTASGKRFRQSNAMTDIPTALVNRDFTTAEYYGADLQLSLDWKAGITVLRGEYIGATNRTLVPIRRVPIPTALFSNRSTTAHLMALTSYLCQGSAILPSPQSSNMTGTIRIRT